MKVSCLFLHFLVNSPIRGIEAPFSFEITIKVLQLNVFKYFHLADFQAWWFHLCISRNISINLSHVSKKLRLLYWKHLQLKKSMKQIIGKMLAFRISYLCSAHTWRVQCTMYLVKQLLYHICLLLILGVYNVYSEIE